MILRLALFSMLVAAPAFAQAPAPDATPPSARCDADGFPRETTDKMTSALLDMGFVGLDKMEIVDGCYRATARNGKGEVVVLTFDAAGELIGLGIGSAPPRYATPRDGLRPAD